MNLLIYCAGGLGREIFDLATDINSIQKIWNKIEFIDDMMDKEYYYGTRIYKFKDIYNSDYMKNEYECIITIGEPVDRKIIYDRLIENNFKLANIIHYTAYVSPTVKLGKGIIIECNSIITSNSNIEDNVIIGHNVVIGHDSYIKNSSAILSGTQVGGNVKIGENVFVGTGCSIKEKISIGDSTIIGMGSVIRKNVGDNLVVVENPSKIICENICINQSGRVFNI